MLKHSFTNLALFSTKTAAASRDKELLMKLRKSTGYSFQNCRKAIEKFGSDSESAEKWLRQEAVKAGWSKLTASRPTTAGLVGVITDGDEQTTAKRGLAIEVNCETDFVARNEKFRTLLTQLARAIFYLDRSPLNSGKNLVKRHIDIAEDLKTLKIEEGDFSGLLLDYMANYSGQLGEKLLLKKASLLTVADGAGELFGYVHPRSSTRDDGVLTGQTASLLALKYISSSEDAAKPNLRALGGMLCQHIVGMNPLCVGTWDSEQAVSSTEDQKAADEAEGNDRVNEEVSSTVTTLSDDTELLKQDFLIEPDVKVGQLLHRNNVQVLDFVRIKCGE